MGIFLFDKYTLLHIGIGFITKYICSALSLSFGVFIMFHIAFEILENTIFREYLDSVYWWPGSKVRADTLINSIGDVIAAIVGWHALSYLELYVKNAVAK